jgi:hypothetical protein
MNPNFINNVVKMCTDFASYIANNFLSIIIIILIAMVVIIVLYCCRGLFLNYPTVSRKKFNQIFKDPDRYKEKKLTLYGRVSQFEALETGLDAFQACIFNKRLHKSQTEKQITNYILYNPSVDNSKDCRIVSGGAKFENITDNYLFKVKVSIIGSYTYDMKFYPGSQNTVPKFSAIKIKKLLLKN